ncbi:galactosylgalactosylxylosylprotein 3-beta-glucuronosyltransferase P-like isoform X2 [Panulirus ornatus]|uniref:galactosylgalactosylxylosylprotein 3-beta-glucuronosyltransferase P-like isoform X2 n=1 Tax=Panulirus ornatus TaxID=150431 RepID=UPI003A8A7316
MKKLGKAVVLSLILMALVGLARKTPLTYVDQRHQNTTGGDLDVVKEIHNLRVKVQRVLDTIAAQMPATTQRYLPTVYVVTPTYQRLEQIPEITRLGQTLMNVPKVHWIVAEDANTTNPEMVKYLQFTGIPYTYLLTPMPEEYKKRTGVPKPRGVANRNGGMDWIRMHATEGVMYFADDDNTYDIRIFEEMRYTKRVSMFPVGLVTHFGLSTPVVKDGNFVEWYDGWVAGRKFPVDMAGFAVSVQFLLSVPSAKMPFQPGYEETGFLSSLFIKPQDLEFVADNCTKIYVWHTKTQKNQRSSRMILDPKYDGTNLRQLQTHMTISDN